MTIRQVKRQLLPFWKDVLNLKEWNIDIKFGTAEEMDDETGHPCQGLNYISVEELESRIFLHKKCEVESTLVHELLHLVFDGHKPQNLKYDALHERALNRTAAALMKMAETTRLAYQMASED